MTLVDLDNLTKAYPRQPRPAVNGVSLQAQEGQLLALLGPSGSGKSTILKLIAGIEEPDSGDVRFDGQSVLRVPANRRSAVLMFQKAYLFPFLTVADNIAFGLKVQGANRQTIRAEVGRMLDLVELPGIERRYPAQLSGGEQQRVALARALVTRPRVLMLDEPLSSLDTNVRQTLQEAIRRIQRELDITTLLVTHDLREAMSMADCIALLLRGAIAAHERPQQLFQRPPTRAAAQFVGVSTFLTGQLDAARLMTGFGALAVQPASGAPRETTYAIRPEHTRLTDASGLNTLSGVVRDVLFKGEFTEYQVDIAEQTVRVRSYQPCAAGPGDAVYVQFPVEHLFEVRED
jgi:ABC-type Fe3+/spermidine/putrescine transport system ATPase subunit